MYQYLLSYCSDSDTTVKISDCKVSIINYVIRSTIDIENLLYCL